VYNNSHDFVWLIDTIKTQTAQKQNHRFFHPNCHDNTFPDKKYLLYRQGACSMGWSDDIHIYFFIINQLDAPPWLISNLMHKILIYLHIIHLLTFNPLNDNLNPICHLLALLGAHHILYVSRIRVKNRASYI